MHWNEAGQPRGALILVSGKLGSLLAGLTTDAMQLFVQALVKACTC